MIIDLNKPVYVMIKETKQVKKVSTIYLDNKLVRIEGKLYDFKEVVIVHDLKDV